jgi:uncharacterized protein YfaS (alpha-2-macroglobulin family)
MVRFVLALVLGALGLSVAHAETAMPDRRLIVTRDMDFYGSDLQALFDTSLSACEKLCLDNPQCAAFTFNRNAGACFPKSAISDRVPYEGAISAQVIGNDPFIIERAGLRAGDLGFLGSGSVDAALQEAQALGVRHGGGQWTPDALTDAADQSYGTGNLRDAIHWTGAALAQTDSAALWLQYGQWSAQLAAEEKGSDRRKYRTRSRNAAINAYLRATTVPQSQTALLDLSRVLEAEGKGRDVIPALRLAESLGSRADIADALDAAIGKYGFRVQEHSVEADSAEPRICAEFSEPLVRAGVDYAPYVRLPDARFAVTSDDRSICITGVQHGGRYQVTFRAGLPAASGEELVRDVPITVYVRDRAPSVGFPGRAYVLPKSADAGLPIKTVNLGAVDLVLRRVSDRNLIRAFQDQYFGRPLSYYAEQYFAKDIAEEVWRGSGTVENRLNADVTTRLPMGDVLGDMPAGVYVLSAAVPDSQDRDDRSSQWFILSDIGLTTLQSTDGLTVFARALGSAEAMAGLEVSLVSRANRVVAQAVTDAQGVARFAPGLLRGPDSSAPAMVMARQGDADFAFLSLTDPGFDLSDRGVEGRAPAGPLDAFLATDRGAYRAGEQIHMTALLRDARADAVPDVPLTAVLTRPDGVEYSRHVSNGGLDGGHVLTLPLAPSVPRGTWRLDLYADPDAQALVSRQLLVEDFVPERIDFDLTLPEGLMDPLNPPRLGVDARYLFGAPGADLVIEGEMRLAASDRLDAFPGYRFGRHDEAFGTRYAGFGSDLVTDADGKADLALPFGNLTVPAIPTQATATLRLIEGSGRPVERSITRKVAPGGDMIGIRPGFDGTLAEQSEAGFDLIALNSALEPVGMEVSWTVNRVHTQYQWYQYGGNWNWEPVTTRKVVARGTGVLGTDPLRVAADVEWGRYEIVVERTDGAYTAASHGFDAGWYAPAEAADTPDMLELSLDRPSYSAGDTATLRMVPRYAGKALVTVLADRVISMQAVEVLEGENTLAVPVTEDWGSGAYVTAQVIRPMDVTAGRNPARALGLTHAAVDPGARHLKVSFDAPAEVAPRGPLQAAVQIDGLGAGGRAHVTVAAVDLGILNLTGFQSPDPADHYFGQRRLGVEIRDIYGRLINGMDGAMGQVRSGGDAAAGMSLQSPPPTEALVAFFSGPVTVDAQGRAEVFFDIPDFNGTVRLMAVAWSRQGVGQAEADVLVRDPVVMTASLPRFLAPGDTSRLLLELTHTKGAAGEMGLEITSEGLGLDRAAVPASVTLQEGGKQALSIPVTADLTGDHRIEVALTTPGGQRLTKSLALGVRSLDPEVGDTRRLSLAPGQTFTLDRDVFAGFRIESASAMVSAGPLAQFDAPGLLAALDRYPYGCTEQVTSKALPLLYLSSVAEPLGIGDKDRIDLRVQQSITKVLTRQAANGAFGLWYAGSGDFWLDAYVTDFLSRARAADYAVPDLAFRQAMDNLKNRIAYAPDFDRGGEDIAYALMVLAREGQAAVGDLRYYADEKADSFATPLALAQMGAALASYGDQPRADAMFAAAAARIAGQQDGQGQVYRADYGSNLRDVAGVLSLAVEARSDAVDRGALIQRISTADGRLSTQEQSWALLAAHAMVRDPATSGLSVDGAPHSGPFVKRINGTGLRPMEITNTSDRPTDITLTTLGVPEGTTEAGGYGYQITRDYYTMEGEPLGDTITTGDRMVAVLTVRPAADTRARLMIDDPLPAGFEIDNPSLLRSGDLRALDWLETASAELAEFRAERFLAAVDQRGDDTIRLAYILRAVSPGTFHHPAALVEDMYRPDYRATTASGTVTVLP